MSTPFYPPKSPRLQGNLANFPPMSGGLRGGEPKFAPKLKCTHNPYIFDDYENSWEYQNVL